MIFELEIKERYSAKITGKFNVPGRQSFIVICLSKNVKVIELLDIFPNLLLKSEKMLN